ncbi:hypothetical protein RB213_001695 [Colletotrichum asianum]
MAIPEHAKVWGAFHPSCRSPWRYRCPSSHHLRR